MGNRINISSKAKRLVGVRLNEDRYNAYSAAANDVDLTLASWIKMAAASYYRSWRGADGKKVQKQNTKDNKVKQVIAEFDKRQEEMRQERLKKEAENAAQEEFDQMSQTQKAQAAMKVAKEDESTLYRELL